MSIVSTSSFCMYYGPEFTSLYFVEWCQEKGLTVLHIQPGKPVQNGHVESFNGRFRDECLNTNWFVNLADARRFAGVPGETVKLACVQNFIQTFVKGVPSGRAE